jgi:hypothetical protein
MTYRKLLAATCRKCETLVDAEDLARDITKWSGRQYLCRTCDRKKTSDYDSSSAGRARSLRRKSGENRGPTNRYRNAHYAVRKAYGKASDHTCYCGAGADHWALMPFVVRLSDGAYTYSPDPTDYTPMCVQHHKMWDTTFARLARS